MKEVFKNLGFWSLWLLFTVAVVFCLTGCPGSNTTPPEGGGGNGGPVDTLEKPPIEMSDSVEVKDVTINED